MTMERLNRITNSMISHGLEALVLNPGPSLVYLTGLQFHLMERPTVLFIVPGKTPVLILPELEAVKAQSALIPMETVTYNDNPATWLAAFEKAGKLLEIKGSLGVEPNRLRYMEMDFIHRGLPSLKFQSAEGILSELRMAKDANEVLAMRKAVEIAQKALIATLPMIKAGVTEREAASELILQLLRNGSDPEMPFQPIVSGGPNAGNPHASPSDRRLVPGDLLVIDWGAACQGYCSDLTRTFGIEAVKPEFKKIADIVMQANAAGRMAGKPGIPAGMVDKAARQVIDQAGYGTYFTHRTGHGLGMEGHEHPYMYAENELLLKPGMTYTVEPGIYLPDGGVRIEDNIVVTESGCETLSDLPRELVLIG